jgi:hypothetical protein
VKPRVCKCCGEAKATHQYSWNQKAYQYSPNCKECGQWLFLFRKVFGPTRDGNSNRMKQRQRESEKRITSRPTNIAGVDLFNAWHQPKDNHA